MMKAALYIHIPFCRARCLYCDFNTYTGLDDLLPDYTTALCREIEAAGRLWGRLTVPSVYFGGGTPSLLPPHLLEKIIVAVSRTFHLPAGAEIGLEANPGTVDRPRLRRLHSLGIDRLSLGIQSARDDELRLLGRIHTWAQAVETVQSARQAGFDNLNLDFIFGLPGQTLDHWEETVRAALALTPEHLSLYCLTVEEHTPLARIIASGHLPPPDDDLAAEMYLLAADRLAEAGFLHYEISNWARLPASTDHRLVPATSCEHISPYVCRHNLTYWRNEPWLGLGAGAHSWMAGRRWANLAHPRRYITALRRGESPVATEEPIPRRLEMGETMMLGLRLTGGVSDDRFRARFGTGLEDTFHTELTDLTRQGLLTWDGHTARLTDRGRLLGNLAFMQFLP